MAKRKESRLILFLICLFLGWFGVDKMYKGDFKLGLIKFLLIFVGIGVIWNIFDIICAAIGKYKLNPLK